MLVLSACNSSKKDEGDSGPVVPSNPQVTSIGGGSFIKVASELPVFIESRIILNELDNPIADGYEFTIYGEDTGIPNYPSTVSLDGITFSNEVVVKSKDARIKFYAKVPTKKGEYKIVARPKNGTVLGRYYVSVDSAQVRLLGEIKGTTYEDQFPYNNKKDAGEFYSLLGDGSSTTIVSVGPILDEYANPVTQARIRLSIDRGNIVSTNPTAISDGKGIFTIESVAGTGPISILAEALDNNNQVIATTTGVIELVRPNLTISETGDFGQVFVNETKSKIFIISNEGNTTAKNLQKSIDFPYSYDQENSTCWQKIQLRPGEQCTLKVDFTGGIRDTFPGNLRVTASPTGIAESSILLPLTAHVVAPAILGIKDIAYTIDNQACGTTVDYQTYIENSGDLPGTNLQVTQPVRSNGQVRDVSLVIPPADVNPDPDMNEIINCGNTIPAGRKCRIIIRFSPTAIRTSEPLVGTITVDGKEPSTLTIRASSRVGDPVGNIPIQLLKANSLTEVATGIDIGDTNFVTAKVGPVVDACNNPISNIPVYATVSDGNIPVSPITTNEGYTNFAWYGTSNVNGIGTQFINVTASGPSSAAVGAKSLVFRGVKLKTTAVTGEIGQILTVNYSPPKYFFYSIKNEGTVDALNIIRTVEGSGVANWFTIEQQYVGGCEDNTLQPGETCQIRVKVDTQSVGPGPLTGQFVVRSAGSGLTENIILLNGVSVNPPVMTFTGGPVINMTPALAGAQPSQVLTLNNTSGNATVNNLAVSVAPPFQKTATTCTTSLAPNSNCTVTVKVSENIKGNYSTFVQASSEYSSVGVNVTASILANQAAGSIAMAFDKASVPAAPTNPTALINVTLGPIKDQYGNNVVAGTVVNLTADKGIMSVDTDGDGLATVTTGSGANEGKATFSIRARSITEITNFTINASVMNGATVLASGTKSGSFTGAYLAFTEDSVSFGQVAVGALDFKVITLKNNGNETASNISWNTTSTDFSLSGQGGCTSLVAGASCNVTVLVNPVQAGNLTGSVNINASGNGIISDTIALSATAIQAAKIVAGNNYSSPATDYIEKTLTINHIPGSTVAGTFKIRNVGQENLEELQAVINTRNSEMTLSLEPACQTLGYNAECTGTLTFAATAAVPSEVLGEITLTGESPSRVTVTKLNVRITSPQLNFIAKPATLQQGACGAFQVQLQNTSEQGVPISSSSLGFNLTKANGTGAFYSNNTCTTTITTIAIANGQSASPIFYYKGTTDGDHTLTVSNIFKSVQTLTKIFTVPQISPVATTVAPAAVVNFTTANGVAPFQYQIVTANGGSIVAATGVYTAPLAAGAYTIKVTDNIGNTSSAVVTVEDIKLSAGRHYWCSTSVGVVKCLGENAFGQYGNAPRKGFYNESIPVNKFVSTTPSIGSNVKYMFAGAYSSCMSNQAGRLYCQGTNHLGTLGDGSYVDRTTAPVAVNGSFTILDGFRSVANNWGLHTCAINSSNELYCWGRNDRGQVGKANSIMAYNSPSQVTVAGTQNFTKVVSGVNHTCALHSTGTINCFGDNTYGQLGDNTIVSQIGTSNTVIAVTGTAPLSNIRDITAGRYHTCAVDNSNIMYCWGRNDFGQLGNNTVVQSNRPIQITTDVKNVYAGGKHTCLVKNSTSQLQCWGNNAHGQLGQGNVNQTYRVPTNITGINSQLGDIALGENFTCFMHQGVNVKCMGENAYGIMGTQDLNNVTAVTTINPSAASPTCMTGATFDSGTSSCKCSSNANVYAYENKACSAAVLTDLAALTSPQYGIENQSSNLGYALKQATIQFSNVPVNYTRSVGNGTLYYTRIITDADAPAAAALNTYVRGSLDLETINVSIGSLSQTMNYRLYKQSCDQYAVAYGDLSAGAQQLLNQAGTATYGAWCRYYGSGASMYGYTFATLVHYNQTYAELTGVLENANVSTTVVCPNATEIVNLVGTYYVHPAGTPSVPFALLDLERTGFIVNDSLNGDPAAPGTSTNRATIRWNCQ